jgi:hypothetical protein
VTPSMSTGLDPVHHDVAIRLAWLSFASTYEQRPTLVARPPSTHPHHSSEDRDELAPPGHATTHTTTATTAALTVRASLRHPSHGDVLALPSSLERATIHSPLADSSYPDGQDWKGLFSDSQEGWEWETETETTTTRGKEKNRRRRRGFVGIPSSRHTKL